MKIRRISDFQCEIQFPIFQENYKAYYRSFLRSDLGKIYTAVPWRELVSGFGLIESKKGPQSIFSPWGKISLMFLKHFAGCSDRKLIEQLNANIHYQIFCDIVLTPEQQIVNYKLVSEIRCELASHLDMKQIQAILADHWNGYCANKDSITCDATCYESYMRYQQM